MNTRGII